MYLSIQIFYLNTNTHVLMYFSPLLYQWYAPNITMCYHYKCKLQQFLKYDTLCYLIKSGNRDSKFNMMIFYHKRGHHLFAHVSLRLHHQLLSKFDNMFVNLDGQLFS